MASLIPYIVRNHTTICDISKDSSLRVLVVGGLVDLVSCGQTLPGGRPGETVVGLNPLITNDAIWHRLTLVACYQLAQSVLKIVLNATMYREAGARRGIYFNPECPHSVLTTVECGLKAGQAQSKNKAISTRKYMLEN